MVAHHDPIQDAISALRREIQRLSELYRARRDAEDATRAELAEINRQLQDAVRRLTELEARLPAGATTTPAPVHDPTTVFPRHYWHYVWRRVQDGQGYEVSPGNWWDWVPAPVSEPMLEPGAPQPPDVQPSPPEQAWYNPIRYSSPTGEERAQVQDRRSRRTVVRDHRVRSDHRDEHHHHPHDGGGLAGWQWVVGLGILAAAILIALYIITRLPGGGPSGQPGPGPTGGAPTGNNPVMIRVSPSQSTVGLLQSHRVGSNIIGGTVSAGGYSVSGEGFDQITAVGVLQPVTCVSRSHFWVGTKRVPDQDNVQFLNVIEADPGVELRSDGEAVCVPGSVGQQVVAAIKQFTTDDARFSGHYKP